MSERGHVLALDGVRGLAILLVLFFHTSVPPLVAGVLPTAGDLRYARVGGFGWAGVDLFFVLSGYLITGILVGTRGRSGFFTSFYMRRVLRILPLYYAIAVLRIFVWPGDGFAAPEACSYLAFWANWYQAQGPGHAMHAADHVLGVAWSLAIEEQFYLVWPCVVFFVPPRVLRWICGAIVVLSPALRALLLARGHDWTFVYLATPCRIDGLAVGALVSLLPHVGAAWWRLVAGAGGLGLGTVIVLQHGDGAAYGALMQTWGYSANAVLAGGAIALAVRGGWCARAFSFGWLRCLGRYSYALYLVHYGVLNGTMLLFFGADAWLPLDRLAKAFGGYWPATFLWFLAVTALSLLVSLLSWNLLEKHMLRLKRFFPAGSAR